MKPNSRWKFGLAVAALVASVAFVVGVVRILPPGNLDRDGLTMSGPLESGPRTSGHGAADTRPDITTGSIEGTAGGVPRSNLGRILLDGAPMDATAKWRMETANGEDLDVLRRAKKRWDQRNRKAVADARRSIETTQAFQKNQSFQRVQREPAPTPRTGLASSS